LAEQASLLEVWRKTFNEERPHEALGMKCPGQLYEVSPRRYEGTPRRLSYPSGWLERQVHGRGTIQVEGRRVLISTALAGWNVGLEPVAAQECLVYFGRLCLGRLDLSTEAFEPTSGAERKPREEA
jgi:hypothetical protein